MSRTENKDRFAVIQDRFIHPTIVLKDNESDTIIMTWTDTGMGFDLDNESPFDLCTKICKLLNDYVPHRR